MSLKIERLESIFEKEISMILQTEIKDKDIQFVTITGVEITNDLSLAKVYFTTLQDDKRDDTIQALNHASKYIKHELSERIEHIRKMPDLKFLYDESIAYGNKIDAIIDEIKNEDGN